MSTNLHNIPQETRPTSPVSFSIENSDTTKRCESNINDNETTANHFTNEYSNHLSGRLLPDNDIEDIDSTDDLDDMDDLKQSGDGSFMNMGDCSNLTGLANNAAMFIEDDKRKRRAIANSNERRRMQSINAGFQTLKSLIPHSSGEKLSKACILQRSADFMQFLSNEKDKLSTKLHVAMKLIDSNGLMHQLQKDQTLLTTDASSSKEATSNLVFPAPKPVSTTKINKQYVSAYNSMSVSTPLLSSALNEIEKPKEKSVVSTKPQDDLKPVQQISASRSPLKSTNKPPIHDIEPTPTQLITPVTATPLVTKCSSAPQSIAQPDSSLILKNQLSQPNIATEITNTDVSKAITEPSSILPSLLIPKIESNYQFDLNPTPLNVLCFQLDINEQKLVEPVRIDANNLVIQPPEILVTNDLPPSIQKFCSNQVEESSSKSPNDLKLTTNALIYLLNEIKEKNPNIDINSATNLMLKSILTSNLSISLTSPNKTNQEPSEPSALLNTYQTSTENEQKKSTNNENDESRILITSSKINLHQDAQHRTTATSTVKKTGPHQPENQQLHISNNHLKNATMASKSSRSNSIDQLIAAAAVTANSSACMSPLSPLHSPVANSKATADSAQSDSADSNELTVSRKNLNTIVEAIFHVEGTSRLDELVDHTALAKQYQQSMPSSSCTASSSTSSKDQDQHNHQQHKPPKKRKYTTEDISQTQDDNQQQSPAKPTNQFISEYYSSRIGQNRSEQPQSINKILARTGETLLASSTMDSSENSKNEAYSNENIVHNKSSNSTNKKKRSSSSNLVGLLVTS